MTAVVQARVPAQPAAPAIEGVPARKADESYELIRRVHAGEPTAFAEVYETFQPTVYAFVYRRVGQRQLAEDITQEVFVRALRRISGFTWRGSSLGAWLVTIARNLIADHYKSGRTRLERLVDNPTHGLASPPESTMGLPETEVLAYLSEQALLTALLILRRTSEDQYQVLLCRFLKGMSVEETAGVMGKNTACVKSVQYRAIRAMARLIAKNPGGGW